MMFRNCPREEYLNRITLRRRWSEQGRLPGIILVSSTTRTNQMAMFISSLWDAFPLHKFCGEQSFPLGLLLGEGSSLCPGTVLAGVGIMGPEEGICTTSPQCQTPSRHTPPAPRLIPNCQSVFDFPQKIRLYMRLHKSLRSQTAASKGLAGWKLGCPAG